MYLLLLVRAVSQGEARYQQFLSWSGSPVVLLLNVVSLLFVVFHAITWFNLAPQAMVVHLARQARARVLDRRRPTTLAWALASALVAWLLSRWVEWPSDRSSRCCGCSSAPAACWRRC